MLRDKTIFYAKGISHPPNYVVAYPKYVPSPNGKRVQRGTGIRYEKVAGVDNEMRYVLSRYKHFVKRDPYFCRDSVPMVPLSEIEKVFNPIEKAMEIAESTAKDNVLKDVKDFIRLCIEVGGVKNIGVSGSILVDLYTDESDIDVVVYGEADSIKMYKFLRDAIYEKDLGIKPYTVDTLHRLYSERSEETPIPFDKFAEIESRRVLEGLFRGREYFIRLIKEPSGDDVYGVYKCRKLGDVVAKLRVVDDSQSIFTPCRYRVVVEEIIEGIKTEFDEVYSLRGRFNEVAKKGEYVLAKGTLEELEYRSGGKRYRVYLGDKGHFMYPLT